MTSNVIQQSAAFMAPLERGLRNSSIFVTPLNHMPAWWKKRAIEIDGKTRALSGRSINTGTMIPMGNTCVANGAARSDKERSLTFYCWRNGRKGVEWYLVTIGTTTSSRASHLSPTIIDPLIPRYVFSPPPSAIAMCFQSKIVGVGYERFVVSIFVVSRKAVIFANRLSNDRRACFGNNSRREIELFLFF